MSNSLALARLDFNLRDGFLVPPLLKNENIGEKMVSKSFLDPARFILTAGDVKAPASTFVDDLLFSSANRVVRFVGTIPSASALFESARLAVVFLIELVMNDASPGGLILDPGGVCAAPDPFASSSAIALVRARFESSLASVPRRSRFVPRSFRLSDLNSFIALPINPDDRRPVLVGDLRWWKRRRTSSVTRSIDPSRVSSNTNQNRPFPSRPVASRAANPTVIVHPPPLAPPESILPRTHPTSSAPSSLDPLSSLARVDRRVRALILSRMSRMSRMNQSMIRVDCRAPPRAMRPRDVSRRRRAFVSSSRVVLASDDSLDARACEEMSRKCLVITSKAHRDAGCFPSAREARLGGELTRFRGEKRRDRGLILGCVRLSRVSSSLLRAGRFRRCLGRARVEFGDGG